MISFVAEGDNDDGKEKKFEALLKPRKRSSWLNLKFLVWQVKKCTN